jgi:MoaA/NifB/PqqE/SkfB family radical SAM enzyme
MTEYFKLKQARDIPRLPLEGNLDLTYRCINHCRHCWLRISSDSPEKENELTFDEVKKIVDEARSMGCRSWNISGGEPMLRPDFTDIFDYITRKSVSYSLNTNGSLITPAIARLLKRKGTKMVALYGATAEIHDHITRHQGSFEASMRGFAYLKEAGAGFIVQIVPMRDNYHQFNDMKALAESLSPHYRIGAAWLWLSACADVNRNKEIAHQRLDPKNVVELDKPDLSYEKWMDDTVENRISNSKLGSEHEYRHSKDDRLFASCITTRRDFHIDPYGQATFCCFIKDSAMRYDLREKDFKEFWDIFIPSLADKVRGGEEYLENCGSCENRSECRWCPVYGYLEHRRFSAKVDYLCNIARENKKFKEKWEKNHRRYFQCGGITIQVESDLPISDATFDPKFKLFQTDGPGEDIVSIRHHFFLPDLNGRYLGSEVYRKPPWAIYKKGNSWIYLGITPTAGDRKYHRVVVFNNDHTRARIYNDGEEIFRKGNLHSLTLFATDQILLARVLADKEGCYLHSSGAIFEDKGFLFAGHSDAGKSTMVTMLKDKAEILCDDRMIVRRWEEGFRIHGTWSHGDIPEVSANSAPLKAFLFLEKANENRLIQIDNKKDAIAKLLECMIRPLVTKEWWEKMLILAGKMAKEVPCYTLQFDKSGGVVNLIEKEFRAK